MMDIGYFKRVAVDPAALDAVDRQIVVRQIVDELQEICDSDAASGGPHRYPAQSSAPDDPRLDNIDRKSRRQLLGKDHR
ncbi:hypothetical protein [Rhizobium laguerreae]|uniref:hypothetical protein n=1 Tax=Rhizobium laguerreae TaxID=1076926 RepID=UPI001FE9DE3D|nr:hypothetical protein [Rhizobium laguerreae]